MRTPWRTGHPEDRPARRGWRPGACATALALAATLGWQGGVAAQEQSTWSGVYTAAQASRGMTVYDASCAACHGENLAAGGEIGPPLAGSGFLEFWEGLTLADVHQVMSISMPEDNPGSLDADKYVDIIAYMLQKSEFPAGGDELTEDTLGEVTIQVEQER